MLGFDYIKNREPRTIHLDIEENCVNLLMTGLACVCRDTTKNSNLSRMAHDLTMQLAHAMYDEVEE